MTYDSSILQKTLWFLQFTARILDHSKVSWLHETGYCKRANMNGETCTSFHSQVGYYICVSNLTHLISDRTLLVSAHCS